MLYHRASADQRPVQMLNREHLQDFNAIRHYLLDKTQHMIGGFGKLPGDVPGPYDSIPPELERLSKIMFNQISYTHVSDSLPWRPCMTQI